MDSPTQDEATEVRNVVQDAGPYANSCGYCRRAGETSWAHGMFAKRISPQAYQDLIDQGWRRSGTFLYKPLMQRSCCDLYTIRLDATAFHPTSTQRKLLRKWDNYLAGTSSVAAATGCKAGGIAAAAAMEPPSKPEAAAAPMSISETGSDAGDGSQLGAAAARPGPDPAAGAVVTLLLRALKRCIDTGTLPALEPPPCPAVTPTPSKLRKRLGADVLFCSPLALQASHTYKKQGLGGAECWSADSVAGVVSGAFNEVAVEAGRSHGAAGPAVVPSCWECFAEKGHLNFRSTAGGTEVGRGTAAMGGVGAGAGKGGAEHVGQHMNGAKAVGESSPAGDLGSSQAAGARGRSPTAITAAATAAAAAEAATMAATAEAAATVTAATAVAAPMELQEAAPDPGPGGGGPGEPAQQQQQQQQEAASRRGRHEFELRMVPARFDQESFELYRRYQVGQHGDKFEDITHASYTRFLVQSPLVSEPLRPGSPEAAQAPEQGYGSFHQQYILDGKLIAVGVVDVLPRCLSSVYFFWDPSLPSLSLGKLSALKELQWVQRHVQAKQQQQQQQENGVISTQQQEKSESSTPQRQHQQDGINPVSVGLHYYYMGFYIHNCHKMRYKADFHPSDLLCPVTKVWVRMSPAVMSALDAGTTVQLSALPGVERFPNLALEDAAAGSQELQQQPAAPAAQELQEPALRPAASGLLRSVVVMFSTGLEHVAMRWEELDSLKIFSDASSRRLRKQLEAWISLVGPAAAELVYEI